MSDPLSSNKLADLWMQHNRLAWSRVKAAFGFELAVIAGWYYAMTDDLPEVALPLAIFGMITTATFVVLATRDLRMRRALSVVLASRGTPLPAPGAGSRLGMALLFVVFLVVNGAMAWVAWKYPDSMAAPTDDDSSSSASHIV